MASNIIIPDASTITVDTSCINVSEVSDKKDQDFLLEKGEKILKIVAKAALEVGRELCEIQERFKTEDNPQGEGLNKFYESVGISRDQASRWSAKYRAFCAYVEIFGAEGATEKFNGLADQSAQTLWNLPADYREAFLADIALGDIPTRAQVQEVSSRPEVKLTKAEELLEAAKVRAESTQEKWEMVKQSKTKKDPGYRVALDANNNAVKAISRYEKRIQELQQEIEDAKAREAAADAARDKAEEQASKLRDELHKYDTDSTAIREARMRRVSNNLIAQLPNVFADIQRFYTEIEHYDQDTVLFLEEHIKLLNNYVDSHL